LTSLITAALAACGLTPNQVSNLPAVNPSPGTFLLLDDPSGGNSVGSALSVVVAADLQNGHVRWRYYPDLPAAQVAQGGELLQPVLEGGLVYVPENYQNLQSHHPFSELVALDPGTGKVRWQHDVAPDPDADISLGAEPVVSNGVVYISSRARGGSASPQDQTAQVFTVEALNTRTGSLLWSRTLAGNPSAPDVADGHVLLPGNDGLVALRVTDGSIAWTFRPGTAFSALDDGGPPNMTYSPSAGNLAPVMENHLVFVDGIAVGPGNTAERSTWFAVNTSSGKLIWQSAPSIPGAVDTRPVLNQSGDALCFSLYSELSGQYVQALSVATGKTLWTHSLKDRPSLCGASGDTFYLLETSIGGSSGDMLGFDSHSGKQLWRAAIPRPGGSADALPPPQENGLAVTLSDGPTSAGEYEGISPVTVIQLSTGKPIWQRDLPVDVTRPVLAVDNEVVVPENLALNPLNPSVLLVAYSLQTASQLWTLKLVSRQ